MRTTTVMVVNPSFPAKTVPEFIAYAKANPGKINMATAGVGSPPHVYGELFNAMAGVDLIPVHYRGGGPALSICSADRRKSCLRALPRRLSMSGQASYAR